MSIFKKKVLLLLYVINSYLYLICMPVSFTLTILIGMMNDAHTILSPIAIITGIATIIIQQIYLRFYDRMEKIYLELKEGNYI